MIKKILIITALIASTAVGAYAGRMSESMDLLNRPSDSQLSDVDVSNYDLTSNDDIINILLVGNDAREELGAEEFGRSDTTMIATIDNKHKCLKLTSLMRDMNLEIPEHGTHKFNSAYSLGGTKLLYKTIASNFGIKLDGFAEVDFSAFKAIINKAGGVDIKITEEEANYLNNTNYIRGAKNRNVKAGWNKMNGAQALGYCRIRKVSNINGTANDQGRTERQRIVLNSLFSNIKKMPMSKWKGIIDAVLPKITTDITNSQIFSYATNVALMGTTDIIQCQIPVNGYYEDATSETDGSVLEIDLETNKELLSDFIFEYDGQGDHEAVSKKKKS